MYVEEPIPKQESNQTRNGYLVGRIRNQSIRFDSMSVCSWRVCVCAKMHISLYHFGSLHIMIGVIFAHEVSFNCVVIAINER